MRVLAELLEREETQTPGGGMSVSYEAVGWAWLAPGARRRRERDEPGGVRGIETMTAEARTDPRLMEGRVLRLSGADWRIAGLADDARTGRTTLSLERDR